MEKVPEAEAAELEELYSKFRKLFMKKLYDMKLRDHYEDDGYEEKVELRYYYDPWDLLLDEELITLEKKLYRQLAANAQSPRNVERLKLLQFCMSSYCDPEACEEVGFREYMGDPERMVQELKHFQNPDVVLEFLELLDLLLARCPEFINLDIFPRHKRPIIRYGVPDYAPCRRERAQERYRALNLEMAEVAAQFGHGAKARTLFYTAFDTFRPCLFQFFFEESKFAQKLRERYYGVVILTKYPHLKALYQKDPFNFVKDWAAGEKLPLLLDTMHQVSFPLASHDRALFEKFRELILPACKEALSLDELFKYLDLARIYFDNGREQEGFEIYKLVCEEIEDKLLNFEEIPCYLDGYYSSIATDATWKVGVIHAGLHKRVLDIIKHVPQDSSFVSDILAFLLKKTPIFDWDFPENYQAIYKTLIEKYPVIAKQFIAKLRENPSLLKKDISKAGLITVTPPKLIKKGLIAMFKASKITFLEYWEEILLDAHPYLMPIFDEYYKVKKMPRKKENITI